jgi:hypothetical protein
MQQKILAYPNIYAELARSGLTVAMLADYMGTSRQNLYNKLRGRTAINERDMRQIQDFIKAKGGGLHRLAPFLRLTCFPESTMLS